ncbi:hypothetical protein EGR_02224 [Echinococcus granulosus]|uniref:Uncharacterized protein n=1 Tax=Echinococcus granulosus TaxID=6210 RepID=W6UNJ5_ECHGR|nr:hypothetical protein EGR_02224 [Echinococcus granulosus]EUB62783.1 hypothetical protein EGR_02224 [Echinococcus granulosus]
MSYCETNPEKLRKLNEEAESKPDRDLGFYPSPISVTDKWLTRVFSPKDPYHSDKGYPYSYKPAGNYLGRPLFATDLHLGTTWGTNLRPFRPKFCQIMERDYLRCLSRVGVQNSDKICRIYWEDLMECTTYEKSKKRMLYMEKVRKQKKLEPMSPPPFTSIQRPN